MRQFFSTDDDGVSGAFLFFLQEKTPRSSEFVEGLWWGLFGNNAILAHDALDKSGGGKVYEVAIMTFGAQPAARNEKAEAAPHEAKTIGVGAT